MVVLTSRYVKDQLVTSVVGDIQLRRRRTYLALELGDEMRLADDTNQEQNLWTRHDSSDGYGLSKTELPIVEREDRVLKWTAGMRRGDTSGPERRTTWTQLVGYCYDRNGDRDARRGGAAPETYITANSPNGSLQSCHVHTD